MNTLKNVKTNKKLNALCLNALCLGILTLAVTACGSDNNESGKATNAGNNIAAEYQGVWQAPAYGKVFKIEGSKVSSYSYTSSYCLLDDENTGVSTADIEQNIRLTEHSDKFELFAGYGSEDFSVPGQIYNKVNTLPESCRNNLLKTMGDSGYQQNYEQDLALFHEFFRDYYFDFETKNIDIDVLYQTASQQLSSITTELELLTIMAEMVAPLADTHIQIISPDQDDFYTTTNKQVLPQQLVAEFAQFNGLPFPIPAEMISQDMINELNDYIEQMYDLQWSIIADYAPTPNHIKTAANGLIRWFEYQNIGYLYIGAMTGYADESEDLSDSENAQNALDNLNNALNLALSDLSHTQGLIVDVRTNNGGNDFISLAIASRFVSSENTHVYSKQARLADHRTDLVDVFISPSNNIQYLSPVVLLTSANTISAAEVFSLSMKQLTNVTLVGEATQGAFSDILSMTLPNGVEIGLSNEFYLSPQGDWFEHTGIPVDIEVPFFSLEQREEEIDLALETAFELLSQ